MTKQNQPKCLVDLSTCEHEHSAKMKTRQKGLFSCLTIELIEEGRQLISFIHSSSFMAADESACSVSSCDLCVP